jgi:protein-tyrosine phosphatase
MAQALAGLGFQQVAATCHNPWDGVFIDEAAHALRRQQLQRTLDRLGVPVRLLSGAEHHSTAVMELAQKRSLVCYPRPGSFLLEFPLTQLPPRLDEMLFRLQVKGLSPAIAHVERYPEVQKQYRLLEEWRERGCAILINLSSLAMSHSRDSYAAAKGVLKARLVDAASTDLHVAGEAPVIADGLTMLRELVGVSGMERLLEEGPARIAGVPIPGGNEAPPP